MTKHLELLLVVREAMRDPNARDFVLGWCVCGMSSDELQRLVVALDELRSAERGSSTQLLLERFGNPRE